MPNFPFGNDDEGTVILSILGEHGDLTVVELESIGKKKESTQI